MTNGRPPADWLSPVREAPVMTAEKRRLQNAANYARNRRAILRRKKEQYAAAKAALTKPDTLGKGDT